jgi:phage-related protein
MPETQIVIFKESDGSVPLRDWMKSIPQKAKEKCIVKVDRLKLFGNELRRPDCDMLSDGIRELRARYNNIHYRILYAFCGKNVVLLSHGCTKIDKVPPKEIRKAFDNLKKYVKNRIAHTYAEEL